MIFQHHELIGHVFLNNIFENNCLSKINVCIAFKFYELFQCCISVNFFLEQLLWQIEHFYYFSIPSTAPTCSINDLLVDIFEDIYDYKFYICMILIMNFFLMFFQIPSLKTTVVTITNLISVRLLEFYYFKNVIYKKVSVHSKLRIFTTFQYHEGIQHDFLIDIFGTIWNFNDVRTNLMINWV